MMNVPALACITKVSTHEARYIIIVRIANFGVQMPSVSRPSLTAHTHHHRSPWIWNGRHLAILTWALAKTKLRHETLMKSVAEAFESSQGAEWMPQDRETTRSQTLHNA